MAVLLGCKLPNVGPNELPWNNCDEEDLFPGPDSGISHEELLAPWVGGELFSSVPGLPVVTILGFDTPHEALDLFCEDGPRYALRTSAAVTVDGLDQFNVNFELESNRGAGNIERDPYDIAHMSMRIPVADPAFDSWMFGRQNEYIGPPTSVELDYVWRPYNATHLRLTVHDYFASAWTENASFELRAPP